MKLGSTYAELGNFDDALRQYRAVHRTLYELGALQTMDAAGLFMKMGAAREAQGEPLKALKAYQAARKTLEVQRAMKSSNAVRVLARLGAVSIAQGDWVEAVKQLLNARYLMDSLSSENSNSSAIQKARLLSDLAYAYAGSAGFATGGLGPLGLVALPGAGPSAWPPVAAALATARPPPQVPGQNYDTPEERSEASTPFEKEELYQNAIRTFADAKDVLETAGLMNSCPEGIALRIAVADVQAVCANWSAALSEYEEAKETLDSWRAQTSRKDFGNASALKASIVGSQAALEARLLSRVGAAHAVLGHGRASLDAHSKAMESLAAAGLEKSSEAGRLLVDLGLAALREAKALEESQRASLWEELQTKAGDGTTAASAASEALAIDPKPFYERALEHLQEARRIFEANRLLSSYQGAKLLVAVGDAQIYLGAETKALYVFEAARKVLEKLTKPMGLFFQTAEGKLLANRIQALEARTGIELPPARSYEVPDQVPAFLKQRMNATKSEEDDSRLSKAKRRAKKEAARSMRSSKKNSAGDSEETEEKKRPARYYKRSGIALRQVLPWRKAARGRRGSTMQESTFSDM